MHEDKYDEWLRKHEISERMPSHKFAPNDLGGKEIVQWERKTNIPDGLKRGAEDSDRIRQWDRDKYNTLCEKYFGNRGQMFYNRSPAKIEAFLAELLGIPTLVLLYIVKSENLSNGYDYWTFGYAYKGE